MESEKQAHFFVHPNQSTFEASLCALAVGHLAKALGSARFCALRKAFNRLEYLVDHLLFGME